MASLFEQDIRFLKGVGEKRTKLFYKLGASTIGDLLLLYPHSYEDFCNTYPISLAPIGTPCCIKAKVCSDIKKSRISASKTIYKLKVSDGFSMMNITFFNNPYVCSKLKYEKEFLFFGRVYAKSPLREMISPKFAEYSNNQTFKPIYRQISGLTSAQIEACVKNALALLPKDIKDPIPDDIREEYSLCSLEFAIKNIHFPKSNEDLNKAKRRLIFEELLTLQLGLSLLKQQKKAPNTNIILDDHLNEFTKLLKFSLTNSQVKVINECLDDMKSKDKSMNRLIQGDVGSGKTAVACAVAYSAIKNNMQVAFMAPTEILAKQHFKFISSLFMGTGINAELLTGSVKASKKRNIKTYLQSGAIDIIIGTHALLSEDVEFKNLGLVITDEQHRFGVSQRMCLSSKSVNPHILVMSATPIPRTLALILYGDLDISIIDELPSGRQPIDTFWIDSAKRIRAFNFIKKYIDQGRQAYIVCPLIDENDNSMISACDYYNELKDTHFKGYSLGLIHGKMNSFDKQVTMDSFLSGDIDILIATTVIEVGVDVPNANIMLIENAERFGLSQLHQLRGRVGRGKDKSFCIMISDSQNEETKRRLNTMTKTHDGFKIASEDLKLRGPGDFFGSKQHGLPDLKIADLMNDINTFTEVQKASKKILNEDPDLSSKKYKILLRQVTRLFNNVNNGGLN